MLSTLKTSRYFIKKGSGTNEKPGILLFDEQGNEVPKCGPLLDSYFERLLTVFNGLPKAVRRNSGGLISVEPSQIVVVQPDKGDEEIRIKVLFNELERNPQNQIISKKVIISSKTVPLLEIESGFTYDDIRTQNFVIDMGLGVIPVHVLSFYLDSQGVTWGIFVRHDEIEKALMEPSSRQISIYEVPQSVLRWIEPFSGTGDKDFQWAKMHVKKLVERGEPIVPKILLIGPPVTVSSGLSFGELEHQLISSIQQMLLVQGQPYFISSIENGDKEPMALLNENAD